MHSALHFTLLHRSDQLHMLTIGQPDLKTFKGSSCLGTIRGLTAKEIPVIGLIVYTDRHYLERHTFWYAKKLALFWGSSVVCDEHDEQARTLLCRSPDTHAS